MSKYSIKDKVSAKLENNITENTQSMAEKDDLTPEEIAKLTPDEFEFIVEGTGSVRPLEILKGSINALSVRFVRRKHNE